MGGVISVLRIFSKRSFAMEKTTVVGDPPVPKALLPNIVSHLTRHQRARLSQQFQTDKRKARKERQKFRREESEALGENAPPKLKPRTIESTRENDVTMRTEDKRVQAEDEAAEEEEIRLEEATDEMSAFFRRETSPQVVVTTSEKPTSRTVRFGKDLARIIPGGAFFLRKRSAIKSIVKRAEEKGFTDVIVINEDHRKMNGMLVCHLPSGPTAHFRLSSVKTTDELKRNFNKISEMRPEVILNNFSTRLGHRVGRLLASLFNLSPEFKGKRVVTMHNQRDYIFFRHHVYDFKSDKRVALRDIGPRFTLKLRSLQRGTFDSKEGEYEWIHKRGAMDTSRRRFHL